MTDRKARKTARKTSNEMTAAKHEITRDDVIAMADYARERKDRRRALVEVKRHRRLAVGPDCTF